MKFKTSIILLIVLLSAFTFTGCIHVDLGPREEINVNDIENVALDGQTTIDIASVSSDIEIIFEDRDDVEAVFKGKMEVSDEDNRPTLKVRSSNRTIEIWIDYLTNDFLVNTRYSQLTVYIPDTYENDIVADSVSGDIHMSDALLDRWTSTTVSGDITLDEVALNDANFSTVSGDIKLTDFSGDDIELDSISGDIEVEVPDNYDVDLDASSISGDIRNRDGHGSTNHDCYIKANTVSGDITVTHF